MTPQIRFSPLPPAFYDRSPPIVAQSLLGQYLVRRVENRLCGGMIVETEAYLSHDDPASHSFRGLKNRNRSMFAGPGTLYVYAIHAKHCMNAVTEPFGTGSAVLIRALEPVWDIPSMQQRRQRTALTELCRGPGMLCQALQIDRSLDGYDLTQNHCIWIESGMELSVSRIRTRPRIGIKQGADLLLRYFIDGNAYVSGRRGDHSVPIDTH